MSDKIRDRIEKLLAKAESTTVHEAEALTEAAEKLMIKHSIDRASLSLGREVKPEELTTDRVRFHGMYQTAWLNGFASVALALGLAPLQTKAGGVTVLVICGFEKDVEEAAMLIKSLQLQSETALKIWWRDQMATGIHKLMTNHERHVAKRTFMEAFGLGAAKRIRENVREAVAETAKSTELAVIDRSKKAKEFADSMSAGRGPQDRARRDYSAHNDGMRAGRNAMSKSIAG